MNVNEAPSLVVGFEYGEAEKQSNLLKYLGNLLTDFVDLPIAVEVIAYNSGISLLVRGQTQFSDQVRGLQSRGVVFRACRNAMNSRNLSEEALTNGVSPVPSGVGRIVKAQLEGAVYFKA